MAAVGLLALAPAANGAFHLIKVREVAPSPAGADAAFIELQMYTPGQTQLAQHPIRIFNATGVQVTSFNLQANAPNGGNQRAYLIGDSATAAPPDLVNEQLSSALGPLGAGGAACFDSVDCVSWGNFTGTGLPSPPGTPGPAIPAGSSLTRSIAPGCATLLEATDDTDDSAADFALAAPSPRNNATAPTETACGDGGDGGDNSPPQTTITKGPKDEISKSRAKVKFKSSEPGSSFECKLDGKKFKPCRSPRKLKSLDDGKHKFLVRAIDPAGNADPTPAKDRFKVIED